MSPGSGRWLLLTAILIGSADCHSTTAPLTVALTSRVKVQPGTQLTLRCGDRMTSSPAAAGPEPLHTGVVQLWHTPFGTLRDAPGVHYSDLDPVSVQHDGSLLISDASSHHSGLYYCLLQDTTGIMIQPYQIHTDDDDDDDEKLHEEESKEDTNQDDHNNSDTFGISAGNDAVQHTPVSQQAGHLFQLSDPSGSMGDPTKQQAAREERSGYLWRAFRVSRDVGGVGSNEEEGAALSVSHLAGAVAASVVVTFLVGLSAGALSRVYVLRCVNAVTERVRRRRPTDATDRGRDVTMTTLPGMYDNGTFQGELESGEEERGWGHGDSAWETTLDTTASTSPSPPAKPQRSFRQKREDAPETTAYLEKCDRTAQEEEEGMVMKGQKDEVDGGGAAGEAKTRGEGESEPSRGGVSGDGGSSSESERPVSETDEEQGNEVREEEEEEERGDGREEEEEQRAGEEKVSTGVGEGRGVNEGEEEELTDGPSSDDESSESGRSSSSGSHEDGNVGEEKQEERTTDSNEGAEQGEAAAPRPPRPARRSRVIRLYQYDEEGQRYGHLPDPASDELGPAPKPKQRSLSLTRLNAIMAAASAGPLDTTPTREEREGSRSPSPPTTPLKSPVFNMDI